MAATGKYRCLFAFADSPIGGFLLLQLILELLRESKKTVK
jgi:hypothetical protein